MQILIKNQIEVYTNNNTLLERIKKDLTFENPMFNDEIKRLERSLRFVRSNAQKQVIISKQTSKISKFIQDFEDRDAFIMVPRGYYDRLIRHISKLGLQCEEKNLLPPQKNIALPSKIVLRDYQHKFIEDVIKCGSGVAVAPPGSGKTTMALEIASRLGYKTLWLTHTSSLVKQTTERIKQFLNVDKVGYIGSGKWDIQDITVALVQTLARRDLTDISKEFGVVVADECHRSPAQQYTAVIKQLWAKHIIGLSATPYRKDGLEPMMFNAIGPMVAKIEKAKLLEAGQLVRTCVVRRKTGVVVPDHIDDYQAKLKRVYESPDRVNKIVGDVMYEASLGNICAVLVDTIAYGRRIKEKLEELGFETSFVFNAERKLVRGDYKTVASMTKKQREELINLFISGKTNILIATYELVAEGFDHQPMNRLFLTGPISPKNYTLLEQSCGRVERSYPGKDVSVIYDYVDDGCSLLNHMSEQRIRVYEENLMSVYS